MLRLILSIGLLSAFSLNPTQTNATSEPPPEKEPSREQFRGRWTTTRLEKQDGKERAYQLILDFKQNELTFFTEEDGKKGNTFTLKLIKVVSDGEPSHLILGHGERSKSVVHFDFVGDRLILVGRLLNRPFEGFTLSGEYKRIEKTK